MSFTPPLGLDCQNDPNGGIDYAALGDHNMHGVPLQSEEWATVTCPAVVAYGAKTAAGLKHASKALADVLPNATLRELGGENHNISTHAAVSLIDGFICGSAPVAA